MKLELKHLAPYLPYKLKGEYNDIKGCVVTMAVQTSNGREERNIDCFLDGIRPILRPLSDLANYGEEGIINEHSINLLIESEYGVEYGMFSQYIGELELVIEGDTSQGYDSSKEIDFKVFQTIQEELLKGHFDIFGLIKEKLAIDINTFK
jgi:hypothetical protein